MARPRPPVSPCAPWPCSGISTPTGLARAATTRRGARRATTSMASSITPTGSTTSSSPPPWEDENYEPRNPMESATLDFIHLLIDQTPTASLLVLLTCRPQFQPSWSHRSYLTEITVNHLSHTHVAQIVTGMT